MARKYDPRKYSDEQRARVVALVTLDGKTQRQAARRFGVPQPTVSRWVKREDLRVLARTMFGSAH